MPDKTAKKILELQHLTRRTGMLHEAQILNLKMWPRVIVPGCSASEVRVDMEKCNVDYNLTVRGKAAKAFKQRLDSLTEATQWMLGAEWQVRIFKGETLLRERPRRWAVEQSKYEGADFAAGKTVPEKPWKPNPKTRYS